MTYAVLRFVYTAYLAGAALLFLHAASRTIFGGGSLAAKLRQVGQIGWFSLVWPLAVFSPAGRRALFKHFNQL